MRRIHVVLLRRLALLVPSVLGVLTLTFFVTRVLPGDPTYSLVGPTPTPEILAKIREQYGFNEPLLVQYVQYLNRILHFDFGTSTITGQPVASDLVNRIPATLMLITASLLIALVVGVLVGTFIARRAGRPVDLVARGGSLVGLALPDFWVGLMLIYVFYFKLGWAPAPLGQLSPIDPQPTQITGAAFIDSLLTLDMPALKASFGHLVLPVLCLGLVFAAPVMRLTRSAMLETLNSNYVRFGRACGLKPLLIWRYALRSVLPPVLTFAAIAFTLLIGGAVLVEKVFSWGGAAQYVAAAIAANDYAAVQAFVAFAGIASILTFLVVDLLYVAIDPRVKL